MSSLKSIFALWLITTIAACGVDSGTSKLCIQVSFKNKDGGIETKIVYCEIRNNGRGFWQDDRGGSGELEMTGWTHADSPKTINGKWNQNGRNHNGPVTGSVNKHGDGDWKGDGQWLDEDTGAHGEWEVVDCP